MKYRRVGASGLKVSEIGLGSRLTYGTAAEKEAADLCIRTAFENGINFFDTSNAYGRGEGEKAMGAVLNHYPRSSYVLSTKVFFPMDSGPNDRGLSRKHIMEQCDASLKRLGMEYIDIYFCHRYDPETPPEETLRALDDLVRQGKILYAAEGVLTGKYKPGQPLPAGSRGANDSTNGVIKSYFRDEVLQVVQQLDVVAKELGLELSQLALAWVLRQKGVSSALIGATKPSQIEENVKAVGVELSSDTLQQIDDILAQVKDFAPLR